MNHVQSIHSIDFELYCCLTSSEQSFSYIMAITSYILMRWWWCSLCTRPTHLPVVRFLSC